MFKAGWALGVALLATAGFARADGGAVLKNKGCTGCHSVDGSVQQGPTFAGLAGRSRRVLVGGSGHEVVADAAYLRRSIVEPDAEVVEGYQPGLMPRLNLSPTELDEAVTDITALASVPPLPPATPAGLGLLLASALAFVGLHVGLSSRPVRSWLAAAIGERAFQGAYSLLVLAAMVGMTYGFARAPYLELWALPPAARWSPIALMPLSIFLMVAGNTTRSPTVVGMESSAASEPEGILRITRHPALWGFTLWGLAHVPPNGDARSLIIFVSVITLSLVGMWHIDARRAATQGEVWVSFAARTSAIPFVAIIQGRNRLALGELGWWRVALSLVLYVGFMHLHRLAIGVPATP